MNIYGCLPSAFFSSPNPVSYWAHAVSISGYPSAESAIASTTASGVGGLNVKKSHVPLELTDVLLKKRSVSLIRDIDAGDNSTSFRVTAAARSLSPSTSGGESTSSAPKSSSLLLHPHASNHQILQTQLQEATRLYRSREHATISSPPPPLSFNGLTSLQALCDADVSSFTSRRHNVSNSGKFGSSDDTLKFGINRILSDDFGKAKKDKENGCKRRSSFPEPRPAFAVCPCSSPGCTAYTHSHAVCSYNRNLFSRAHHHHHHHLPSLSAVHALQPPNYPMSSSVDALPGPYSILSTEANSSNQPKRKRSWSRAVFSNLQRKGLEKRFEVQKYVTKPDRRQLAAMLGLTDAQVKVWFQNRRMKWRHAQQQGEKDTPNQGQDGESAEEKKESSSKPTDLSHPRPGNQHEEKSSKCDADALAARSSHQGEYTLKAGEENKTMWNSGVEVCGSPCENSLGSSSPEIILNVHTNDDSDLAIAGSSRNGLRGESSPDREDSDGTSCEMFRAQIEGVPNLHHRQNQGNLRPYNNLMEYEDADADRMVYRVTSNKTIHECHTSSSINRPNVDVSTVDEEIGSDEDSRNDEDSSMRDIDVED